MGVCAYVVNDPAAHLEIAAFLLTKTKTYFRVWALDQMICRYFLEMPHSANAKGHRSCHGGLDLPSLVTIFCLGVCTPPTPPPDDNLRCLLANAYTF